MSYNPQNPNGQATSANSSPVVIASDQSNLPIQGNHLTVTYTTTSAVNTTATDVSAYQWVSVQQTSTGGSSVSTFQGSNDNSNWLSVVLQRPSQSVGAPVATAVANNEVYAGPLNFRYFRIAITGIVSGTTAGTIEFLTIGRQILSPGGQVSLNGTTAVAGLKTNNNAVPGATNLGVLPGVANAAAPTYTETDQVLLSLDLTGNTRVLVNGGLMPTNTALNTYSVHLTSNTTTTPTSSTAYISSISISSEVAGTTSTVTIQDKQGTPLKLVNGFSTTTLTTTPTIVNFQTPVKMVSGIDIVTAGAVAATIDIWINYYQ